MCACACVCDKVYNSEGIKLDNRTTRHSPMPRRDNNTCNILRFDNVPSAIRKQALCLNVKVPFTSRNSNFFFSTAAGSTAVVIRASVSCRR